MSETVASGSTPVAVTGDGGADGHGTDLRFPDDFLWGTASYQVEGAVYEDGRGVSIWDTFCQAPGTVHHGDVGDVACDAYHRVEQDVSMMAGLGFGAYRFSVAWPRVQPDGSGPINQRGLDHYRRLVELLRNRRIKPAVTLYHWDLPQALEDRGGWLNRTTADRFADYAGAVAAAIDGAELWITINEPWVAAHEGYALGSHAPGHKDFYSALVASHHLLLAHGRATRRVHEVQRRQVPVGITLNLMPVVPASPGNDDDVKATRRFDGYHNRWYLGPVLSGQYPEDMVEIYGRTWPLDFIEETDLAEIKAPSDFLGVNCYSQGAVQGALDTKAGTSAAHEVVLQAALAPRPGLPQTAKGWPIQPDGLREILVRISREYPGLPMYITENGAAYHDYVDPRGEVRDPERVSYLKGHLQAVHRAISEGADVRGYFCWSFIDNLEWDDGFSQRFGLVWVDHKTQERVPKTSAKWYSMVARANRVEV